ncbi:MAG TPA: LysM peptidoglycan-binding domain-containing protein [Nitrospiria bacterium]|nr:LysM peptidoglycan-binding domain-containing protein [Nitrospiria bacterium]
MSHTALHRENRSKASRLAALLCTSCSVALLTACALNHPAGTPASADGTPMALPSSQAAASSQSKIPQTSPTQSPPATADHALRTADPAVEVPGTIIDEPVDESDDTDTTDTAETNNPPADEEPTYDVPIVINESVEGHLEYFQTTIRERFAMWLQRSKQYLPVMKEIFKQHGLPEDLVFVALIESGFNPYAYSRSRAAGPWQFITGTGRKYGLKINEWIDERRDPIKSTEAAARYLKDLYDQFGSWPLALASYNAGEGKVARAIAKTRSDDFWKIKETRHLRPETRNYVPKFMAATIIAKNPEKYGFALTDVEPFRYDEAPIDSPTDLHVIAKAAGVDYDVIKQLNPELRQGVTPLYYPNYQIKLPPGTRDTFMENFSKIPKEERLIWIRHTVRQGETLSQLARRYGTTVKTLRDTNHMGHRTMLSIGSTVIIPAKGATAATVVPASIEADDSAPQQEQHRSIYHVQSGDTLWDIARQFGVTIKQLQRWNHLPSTRIRTGQRLILYLPGQLS